MQEVGMTAFAGAMLLTAGSRFRPLWAIQRGVIWLRAVGITLRKVAPTLVREWVIEWPYAKEHARRDV